MRRLDTEHFNRIKRIEEKQDEILEAVKTVKLRVSRLEHHRTFGAGFLGGIAALLTYLGLKIPFTHG